MQAISISRALSYEDWIDHVESSIKESTEMKSFKEYIQDDAPTMSTGSSIDLGEPKMLFKKKARRNNKKLFNKNDEK